MIIKTFIEPPIENNNYLLIDELSKEAVLIDCSAVEPKIQALLNEYGAELKYILLTHGHFDHVAGIRPTSAKIVMSKLDLPLLSQVNQYLPMFGMSAISVPKIDVFVDDGSILKVGEKEIKVIHTPGHTQGGVCYYIDDYLFSGDTIFREAVGRCDLPGGNFEQIVKSIENKIYKLPDDTIIYPGHGKQTTVGWEKEHNLFL